jgi:hypothetical protein
MDRSPCRPSISSPAMWTALQDRAVLQASAAGSRRLQLSLLDARHEENLAQQRHATHAPTDRTLSRRCTSQACRLRPPYPDRLDRSRVAAIPLSHPCSTRLVFVWLVLRTIRPGVCPSELVTATALRNTLPDFLLDSSAASIFTKFLRDNIDLDHARPLRLSG